MTILLNKDMDTTQLILFSAAMIFLAVRIYQKYFMKSKGNTRSAFNEQNRQESPVSLKDNDYEPYSKK